jgi:hypothetical protein
MPIYRTTKRSRRLRSWEEGPPIDSSLAGIGFASPGFAYFDLVGGNMLRCFRVTILCLILLMMPLSAIRAQEKGFEVDIHSNVRLVTMPIPEDMPPDFKAKYLMFLGQLKDSIKAKTTERTPADALIFQVRPGIKEIGAAKTKRPMASIIAFKKDSRSEFRGDILLFNYATGESLSKEDVDKFLAKQILFGIESE